MRLDRRDARWHIAPVPPRDPSLRPYRFAAWIAYFAVIVVLGTLVVGSISRNLWGRPRHAAPSSGLPTRSALRGCMTDLDALFLEQNQRAWALGTHFEAQDPVASWSEWAGEWEERVDDLSDRCRLDESKQGEAWGEERAEMAAARDAMLALHRAYRTRVERFAQEQGDLARLVAEAMAHARRAVAAAGEGR